MLAALEFEPERTEAAALKEPLRGLGAGRELLPSRTPPYKDIFAGALGRVEASEARLVEGAIAVENLGRCWGSRSIYVFIVGPGI